MKKIILILMAFVAAIAVTSLCKALDTPAKRETKYSLAVYHFNLEYVAGDTKIENKIIVDSLDPLLDFYLRHPAWGADFEMQGYMIVETAKRYPAVFEKLKKLVDRGQISLVSFHYADQLFLAYPKLDMEWSDLLNRRVFEKFGLKRSGAVFAQEGQFGEGMANFMADHGFTVLMLPKNLYRYAHGEEVAMPYYRLNGVSVVLAAQGVTYEDTNNIVKVTWSYVNDAELLPTGGATPYSEYFKFKPEALEKYEEELLESEKQGYKIGTVEQYVADLKSAMITPAKLKPMIDGDWQPKDTENIYRWMGNYLGQHERDNEILTTNVKVRHRLAAAEILIGFVKDSGFETAALEADLAEAWRLQSHAEVSDATGWTPFPVEIEYSEKNSAAASALVDKIAAEAKKQLGANAVEVDASEGAVRLLSEPPAEPAYPEVSCPVDFKLEGEIEKERHRCLKINDKAVRLDIQFKTANSWKNNLKLVFQRKADYLLFSPSLQEETYVKYPIADFTPESNEFYIPASNGLIALEDGLFLIKKTDTVHVAYRFGFDRPEISLGMNKPPSKVNGWSLCFFRGTPEEAVKFANTINVFPKVVF